MLIISQLIISAKISVLKSTNMYPNYWIASFNFKHFKLNTPGIEFSLPTLTQMFPIWKLSMETPFFHLLMSKILQSPLIPLSHVAYLSHQEFLFASTSKLI